MAFKDFNDFSGKGWVPMNIHTECHLNEYDQDYLSRTRSGAWKKLLANFNQGGHCQYTRKQLYRRGWRVVRLSVTITRPLGD